MEITLVDKIYNALQVYDEGSQYREAVAESVLGKVFDERVVTDLGTISEEILLNHTAEIKKIIAAARKIAQATGDTEIEEESPYEMAAAADDAVERLKQTLRYANGEIEYEELANLLIDRAEARLVVCFDRVVDRAVDGIPLLMSRVPRLAPLAPIAKSLMERIKPDLQTKLHKGIHQVATHAKKLAPKLIDAAKHFSQRVKQSVKQKLIKIATV